jgi:hypothetical protein
MHGGGNGVGYIKCNEGEFIFVNVTEGKKKTYINIFLYD